MSLLVISLDMYVPLFDSGNPIEMKQLGAEVAAYFTSRGKGDILQSIHFCNINNRSTHRANGIFGKL